MAVGARPCIVCCIFCIYNPAHSGDVREVDDGPVPLLCYGPCLGGCGARVDHVKGTYSMWERTWGADARNVPIIEL